METINRDLFASLISDLNTLTKIAQANVITRDVQALAVGESRPAAVLFVDIVNYSELSNKLPNEKLSMLIDRIFQIFELSAKAYGGYCDKVIGDAGLYVFPGHPAHPPAIEGALRTGLVILERAAQLRFSLEPQGIDFNVRIGVAFGDVTRERVGGTSHQFTVMGSTVNLSQRLEGCADPGTMQVLPELAVTVGDLFQIEPVGERELKNIGNYPVMKVVKLNERIYQFRTSGGYLSKFVGRDKEFEEASNIIDEWLKISYSPDSYDITKTSTRIKKRNRMLIISGAMAMGKSRMAYELIQSYINKIIANTTTAHCLNNNMLDIFAAELVRVAGINTINLADRWEQLCLHSEKVINKEYADRHRKHLPLLALLLNSTQIDTSKISNIDPQSFVLSVKLAFCAACELIGHYTGRPVIITIEDIQWLSSYEDLLINILESAALPQPLIIIATARPEYEHNAEVFGKVCEWHNLSITPIGSVDGRALVESILPGLNLSVDAWRQIDDKATGIPYYYEEFSRMLAQRGYVVDRNGSFELVRELIDIELPSDIQMLILGKLDLLEPKLKLLVSKASVLGCMFKSKLLIEIESKLLDGEPEKLPGMLGQLVDHEIFSRERSINRDPFLLTLEGKAELANSLLDKVGSISISLSDIIDDDKYFFKHIVTQESAYKAMLERNKWVLHSLAAEILESMIVEGSKTEKDLVIALIPHIEFLERYLEVHKRYCQILKQQAFSGQYKNWEVWETRALRAWQKAVFNDSSLPIESPWWLHYVLGLKLRQTGNFANALIYFEKALLIYRGLNDRSGEGNAFHSIGLVYDDLGNYEKAMEHYEQSLAIKRELGDRRGEGTTLYSIGNVHKNQGGYDKAVEFYEQSLAINREVGFPRIERSTLHNIGNIHQDQGRLDEAMSYYEQSLTISREVGDRRIEGYTLNSIGLVLFDKGKLDEALDYFEQSLAINRELGDRRGEINTIESLTQLMIKLKDFKKAREYCQDGEKTANYMGDRELVGYFTADWVLIYAAEGNFALAHEYFLNAKVFAAELKVSAESKLIQLITKAETALEQAQQLQNNKAKSKND